MTSSVKEFILDIFDVITFLVFVGGIVLFIRFFVFNPYTVVGESMSPTYHGNDFIIVDKVKDKENYKRGEVVVFVPSGKDVPYIKRIVGLPGDTVKVKDGKVEICPNGTACSILQEPYLPNDTITDARCGVDEFKVTNGYLVFGDNRSHSTDSRCCFGFGCYESQNYVVTVDRIIGRVAVKLYSSQGDK